MFAELMVHQHELKKSGLLKRALATLQATVIPVFLLSGLSLASALAQYAPPPPPPPPTPDQTAPQGYPQSPPPQGQEAPPPAMAPQQLDQLVGRVALYPDPLLAQILTASTFYDQIPQAAMWANQHAYLTGDPLADAIREDNLPWDPSVLALLPFPSVLQIMAQDLGWTQQLGNAVLVQRPDVMDAVQRMRQQAYNYGYLAPTPYYSVANSGGYIQILPVNPAYLYVPIYSPAVVYFPPRPGIVIGFAIHFAPSIYIGPAFVPFGWAHPGFGWGSHAIYVGGAPWGRTWANRYSYVHSYPNAYRPVGPAQVEHHSYAHQSAPPPQHHGQEHHN